jgi:DNA polymerase III delta prime subunit
MQNPCHHAPPPCWAFTSSPAAAVKPQVARNDDSMNEFLKLEFLREIGFAHMRIGDGVNSRLQLTGMLAKLCRNALAAAGG